MARRKNLKRKFHVQRTPGGKPVISTQDRQSRQFPTGAVIRRAEACGIDGLAVMAAGGEAVIKLCTADTAGTALGRLMWRHSTAGERTRRLMDGTNSPLITDDMDAAAESYRSLWAEWYRATGLPRRHPQPGQMERKDKSVEVNDVSPERMARLRSRLDAAEKAVDALPQRALVWATIDSVVIDDVLPGGMEFGERSSALQALRRGLEALARVL